MKKTADKSDTSLNMLKKLNILHVASFWGNIGDNANHAGTRALLSRALSDCELAFTNFEIRDVFRKEKQFDDDFACYVNGFDLMIFGGGNFFELWVESSCNSTSVDIPIGVLKKIQIPIIFHSLGMDPSMGIATNGIKKFSEWLEYVHSRKDFLVSLRNDGSMSTAQDLLDEKLFAQILSAPDGGFFSGYEQAAQSLVLDSAKLNIGINIAGDMLDKRFKGTNDELCYSGFLRNFSNYMVEMKQKHPDCSFVFFAHIYKDIKVISDLFEMLPEKISRSDVILAPYIQGESGFASALSVYRQCDLILANRFHANVIGISNKIPTLGLVNYPQISFLYAELSMEDMYIDINKEGFSDLLLELASSALANAEIIQSRYSECISNLSNKIDNYYNNHVKKISIKGN